ncbi:putative quinol monooxygenase [uncultured Salegentibacter sp.]|uniref:putative quinol monooxygenase n=1 Tax=uncultured Salegentibacter sp. TaxID=259320 RepID=UPI0030DA97B1
MKFIKSTFTILALIFLTYSCGVQNKMQNTTTADEMLIRISEIKIEEQYLEAYIKILKYEAEASVRLEPGVISIYPMFQKENPTEIRILEIYADNEAYKAHLETPHFKEYKSSTLNMVESLKLIDMEAIDAETMSKIFKKLE